MFDDSKCTPTLGTRKADSGEVQHIVAATARSDCRSFRGLGPLFQSQAGLP